MKYYKMYTFYMKNRSNIYKLLTVHNSLYSKALEKILKKKTKIILTNPVEYYNVTNIIAKH